MQNRTARPFLTRRGSADPQQSLTGDPIIDLRRVVKQYNAGAAPLVALKGVDLRVDEGEFVAVLGKSGAGKTTLINMIAGLDQPTAGVVSVAGTAVHTLGENRRAVWRGRWVGIVLQFFQLVPALTVLQNVMLPMDLARRCSLARQRERALQLLDQVGLARHADKMPSAMSGGERQRIAIARALANDPPILLGDEPTGNLDSATANEVLGVFERLVGQGRTLLLVTHDPDLARRAGRTVVLSDGEIMAER